MSDLSLRQLRLANVTRREQSDHRTDGWTLDDWSHFAIISIDRVHMAVQEIRSLDGLTDVGSSDQRVRLYGDLARRLAQTMINLDMLAAHSGIDLCEAVRAQFNATSERVYSQVRL